MFKKHVFYESAIIEKEMILRKHSKKMSYDLSDMHTLGFVGENIKDHIFQLHELSFLYVHY